MTKDLKQRIAASIARNPGKADWQIAKNFKGVTSGDVALVRGKSHLQAAKESTKAEPLAAIPAAKLAGISLQNRAVLSRRPAESAAKYIRKLPNGKAFAPGDLARAWGMSEETIRKHARDMECLKFVEVEPDDWKAMIMNPETAKNYQL